MPTCTSIDWGMYRSLSPRSLKLREWQCTELAGQQGSSFQLDRSCPPWDLPSKDCALGILKFRR